MVDKNSQVPMQARLGAWRGVLRACADPWGVAALVIAGLVLLPLAAVVWMALHPTENIWPHLMATVMPRYMANTLTLMAGVAVLGVVFGTGTAWLVTIYRFPFSRMLAYALLFPLAIPAYVGAFALVDLLQYAGPVQGGLRALMGWESARDYWFPEVRSTGFAVIVLSAALYPYVYLLARAAFREQSGVAYEVARALGAGPWAMFLRVGLPLARPAIAAGVALALMEVVADYGTVSYFSVQTLTTGIFSTWLNGNNAGGAAQIAGVVLVLIFGLLAVERAGRRRARFYQGVRGQRPVVPMALSRGAGWAAAGFCLLPFAIGFVLPVAVMVWQAMQSPQSWLDAGLFAALGNTLVTGSVAAGLTVGAAVALVYGLRQSRLARVVTGLTQLGYAAPGAVLGLGILIPLAALDHRLADGVLALTGYDPGLVLTGTAAALVLAYVVRFFGVAQGAVEAAFGRVPPHLPMAARSLGRGPGGALRAVHLPLMRGSVLGALVIVFVDCVKELPATLLLRPFNYDTLATRTFELASLERLSEAAPAALLVMAVGLCAVAVLARTQR